MSQSKRLTKISKFLSYVLRHAPEHINLQLDAHGWADIEELMQGHARRYGVVLYKQDIIDVVATCEKKRYELSEDQARIRAAQGHSIEVDVGAEEREPPAVLYHGTAQRFYDSIKVSGISRMQRQHVHLSADVQTAMTVGARHGTVRLLKIDTARMHADGIKFWISANGVWLTDHVDPKYLFKAIKENA